MSVYVDIEKRLGSFCLNVKFEAGNETLALLGASGCGKSMTLKCIAGIEVPDRGRIVVDDVVLFDSEKGINLTPQQRRTGFLFQNYALFPNMTVLQNIRSGASREPDRKKRDFAVTEIMESFGLQEMRNLYPHQLSGGQQQRTALARILVSAPEILLLDEPFSALDSHLRFRLEQEVRQVIRDFGKTVILVSHDRDEVFRMSSQIVVMDRGHVETSGRKEDVFRQPRTRAAAMLTGCKNILPIQRIGETQVLISDWDLVLETDRHTGRAEYIGIRMHDIAPGGGPNTVLCHVEEEIENPFSYTIILRPAANRDAPAIGWELTKPQWQQIRQKEIAVRFPPDALQLLGG